MQKFNSPPKVKQDNLDPLTGTPGAHPLGTGVGATGGGLAGAAIGAVGGPIGAGIGLAVGAIAGGLAGKAVAEQVDPTAEEAYWRDNYASRPYVKKGDQYDVYGHAYSTGYENFHRYNGKKFDDVEKDLQQDYEKRSGTTGLSWDKARHATRDAWQRAEDFMPGDVDHDGH